MGSRTVNRRVDVTVHGGAAMPDEQGLPVRADFSVSLNAYGAAPVVRRALLQAARGRAWEAYPEATSEQARRIVAERWNCAPDSLAVGGGAAELIHAVSAAVLAHGDRVLVPRFAFGEYERSAVLQGAHVTRVGRWSGSLAALGMGTSLAAYLAAVQRILPRLVFLCSPGNPAGRGWSVSEFAQLADACARVKGLLVIDQAYDDFLERPVDGPALPSHPAVIHLHSLTKAHALAGVRVALASASPAVIRVIESVRPPWPVSFMAQEAVTAAFSDDARAYVRRTTRLLRRHAGGLISELDALGIPTAPTDSHMLLARVGRAAVVRSALLRSHGVRVRDCSSFGLPEYIRVAARTPSDNALLLTALATLTGATGRDIPRSS